ncbi:MAG TPA: L,D-transpeptidase family protein [Candidatus Binatia bacterium]|nr:L,D-transpeptidase family protein [Candidatus Binatia bacterium]
MKSNARVTTKGRADGCADLFAATDSTGLALPPSARWATTSLLCLAAAWHLGGPQQSLAQYYPDDRVQSQPRDAYYPPREPYYPSPREPYYPPRPSYREPVRDREPAPPRPAYREPVRGSEPEPARPQYPPSDREPAPPTYRDPSRPAYRDAPRPPTPRPTYRETIRDREPARREPVPEPARQAPREYPSGREYEPAVRQQQNSPRAYTPSEGFQPTRSEDTFGRDRDFRGFDQPSFLGDADGYAGTGADQLTKLSDMLSRYENIDRAGGWSAVPSDKTISRGGSYDCGRIHALERRLAAENYLQFPGGTPPPAAKETGQCKFGEDLSAAIKKFQADRGMNADGNVGPATFRELNRPTRDIVSILERNVQRWRELSIGASDDYILVNIPWFELSVYSGGRPQLSMPVIVGLPTWQTPQFSDVVEYIVINPEWGIPESIASKEVWPKARRDKGYFRREGIVQTKDGHLRQKPGPQNPLGRLKFMMPNKNNVYLHDTPGKKAFSQQVRALSHGCIRVSKPVDLAEYLLGREGNWTPQKLQSAIRAGKTVHVNLENKIPVHIVYFTARVNDEGRLELRKDVYGHDTGVQVARDNSGLQLGSDTATADSPADDDRVGGLSDDLTPPAWPWADQKARMQTVR